MHLIRGCSYSQLFFLGECGILLRWSVQKNIDATLNEIKENVNSAHWLYTLSFGLLLPFSIKLIRFLILLAHFFSFFPRSLLHILSTSLFRVFQHAVHHLYRSGI
jgi:hypothetical protein